MSLQWKKFIFFGDSLTQFGWSDDGGWLARIADKYQRKYDVINRGFSGYNSKWCNMMLPQLFDKRNLVDTALFVIFLGANDSNLKEINPHQSVSIEEFKIYLSNMVSYLMSSGLKGENILIISTPPVDEEKWSAVMEATGDASGKRLYLCEQYSDVSRTVSANFSTLFYDLYGDLIAQSNWKSYFCDGLHFSREGSIFLSDRLTDLIDSKLAIVDSHYPLWSMVDNDNPQLTLI